MFRKPPYTQAELSDYAQRLETIDRLCEKAKRNYLGTQAGAPGEEAQRALQVWDGYTKTLLVAQETYQRMLQKTAK